MSQRLASWLAVALATLLLEVVSVGATLAIARASHLQVAETISLGQLIVALVLIPVAVVAFWQARVALAQSAARPRLCLAFLGEDGLLYDVYWLNLPINGREGNRLTLALENQGDAIAVWWQVSFDLPLELLQLLRLGDGHASVFPREVAITMDTVGDSERYVAQGAGAKALFPGPPIQVALISARLDPNFDHKFKREYPIRFELVTDRSKRVTGSIPLRIGKIAQ
jgi:hypothetical protein